VRAHPVANSAVVAVGALWGLYWIPLRRLEALTGGGPWVSVVVLLVAAALLLPFGWRQRHRLRAANTRALASIALGGVAFALYSDGLLFGQVAVVILLFYLTPVWSTLIARVWLGWPVTWWRRAAIVAGFGGIALVLHGSHDGLPLPRTTGDWLGLASGLLWAVASTGIHVHSRTGPAETNFVFCAGGVAASIPLALWLGTPTAAATAAAGATGTAFGLVLLLGGVWWAGSLTFFMWATQRLEPARVGILLMSEVIMGALSAALFAGEAFGTAMAMGTVLVIVAGVLETFPMRPPAAPPGG